jgi:pimeloyl-ACP methyl ester carboxylesterase
MTTFILVHGAWHGAWCWDRVAQRLAQAGCPTVAVDLPCDEVTAGWSDYADAVVRAVKDEGDRLVAVGHSLGGGVVPLLAGQLPLSRAVLVGSMLPEPGRSLNEVVADEPGLTDPRALVFRESLDLEGRFVWPDFGSANYAMYHDCRAEEARWAFSRLRPQATKPFADPWPLTDWPDVPMTYVVCSEDRMGRAECLAGVARRRFGLEPVELAGGHSPFLSRPADLVEILLGR